MLVHGTYQTPSRNNNVQHPHWVYFTNLDIFCSYLITITGSLFVLMAASHLILFRVVFTFYFTNHDTFGSIVANGLSIHIYSILMCHKAVKRQQINSTKRMILNFLSYIFYIYIYIYIYTHFKVVYFIWYTVRIRRSTERHLSPGTRSPGPTVAYLCAQY